MSDLLLLSRAELLKLSTIRTFWWTVAATLAFAPAVDAQMAGLPKPFGHQRFPADGWKHVSSPAGATGGNRSQMR